MLLEVQLRVPPLVYLYVRLYLYMHGISQTIQ